MSGVFSWLGMGPNIKEQQQLFQSLKKLTGNTTTATGNIANAVGISFVFFGGIVLASNGIYNMAYGTNKIPQKE